MPDRSYGQALTNAAAVFDGASSGSVTALTSLFDDVLVTTATLTTADIALPIAHGLSGTPDFVLLGFSGSQTGIIEGFGWTANATTLTILKTDTQAQQIASVFAAVLG